MSSTYFAHSGDSAGEEDWQPLVDHLEGTGARAARFLADVGASDLGRIAGLLHDLGKYTPEFQARLRGGWRCDHATAGAKVAIERYGDRIGKMLGFCIAGHHAGLANGVNGHRIGSLADRLEREIPRLSDAWRAEITLGDVAFPDWAPRSRGSAGFSIAFWTRMIFSALVDADYLDTEEFYDRIHAEERVRGEHPPIKTLATRLGAHLDAMRRGVPPTGLNELRRGILRHAHGMADQSPGVFTLTVPTGGGKTLASLAFALEHALRHDLRRVIYVIPYMSIVEQTAAVFRDALADAGGGEADFVIEHHSSIDEEQVAQREGADKLQLAMENWDAPVVVTTAVQFFESLFANRPSRCRKLHNIARSVVVLDEAQTLPIGYLRPCVAALDELARNWRTSIVLCTATQPALSDGQFRDGFANTRELAPDPPSLYQALKRTRIRHLGTLDDANLAERLRRSPQVLCIVNTRRHARELFEMLAGSEGACHLTTLMCAAHRRVRLAEIRGALSAGTPVRLVATSLIEAGVDIDFPEVWRAEAGIESLVQAAGRCNRERRAASADVFVFRPQEGDGRSPPPEIAQASDVMRSVARQQEDLQSLEAVDAYFRELYWTKGDDALDAKGILRMHNERAVNLDFPFETVARDFRVVETPLVPVIVPYKSSPEEAGAAPLVEALRWAERPGAITRQLQPYVVQIPPQTREALVAAGAAVVLQEGRFERQFVWVANGDIYDDAVGLQWDDPSFRTAEGLIC